MARKHKNIISIDAEKARKMLGDLRRHLVALRSEVMEKQDFQFSDAIRIARWDCATDNLIEHLELLLSIHEKHGGPIVFRLDNEALGMNRHDED